MRHVASELLSIVNAIDLETTKSSDEAVVVPKESLRQLIVKNNDGKDGLFVDLGEYCTATYILLHFGPHL